MAYKNGDEIKELITPADIIDNLKPVYNFKGCKNFMNKYCFYVVKITNFLSFKSSNVPLLSNPIVVSRNGFGKTAVCKAVAFALGLKINTDIKKVINYEKDKTCVSVVFRKEEKILTVTRKYYKNGKDLFFINEKQVELSEVRKIFPEEDFCILNENMSKGEILKNLDGEYQYFIFDNIDAKFSRKELENILIPKLEKIIESNKSGFLTTNSEIVLENIGYTEVHINYKKHIGSVCTKVSLYGKRDVSNK